MIFSEWLYRNQAIHALQIYASKASQGFCSPLQDHNSEKRIAIHNAGAGRHLERAYSLAVYHSLNAKSHLIFSIITE